MKNYLCPIYKATNLSLINLLVKHKTWTAINRLRTIEKFVIILLNYPVAISHLLKVIIHIGKGWTAINRLMTLWKCNLSDNIKWEFFQTGAISVLLYGFNTWTLLKDSEKKLDGDYTRMLHAVLNKSWKQQPTKQ